MAQAFSELTIHTRRSPLSFDAMGKRGLRAGDRALDAPITQGHYSIRLYDLILSWPVDVARLYRKEIGNRLRRGHKRDSGSGHHERFHVHHLNG